MFPEDIEAAARRVVHDAVRSGVWLATAESCTGGLIAAALTQIPGSSEAYEQGFITYSNSAKSRLLHVPASLLTTYGAVSEPVARAMADGTRLASGVDIAVSVTGIAGPGGGSADKPVGLVHFGLACADGTVQHHVEHYGDLGRERVRLAAVKTGLALLQQAVDQVQPRP